MKYLMTAALIAVGVGGWTARASAGAEAVLVDGWYRVHLGRCADPGGLAGWVGQLRCAGPEAVRAGILSSDEYYCRHGGTSEGFVTGLYREVLGREPDSREVDSWVCNLRRCGDRRRLALDFLVAARTELALRAALASAPPGPCAGGY
jgi:hypothetical protein